MKHLLVPPLLLMALTVFAQDEIPPIAPDAPQTPSALKAVPLSPTELRLSWTLPESSALRTCIWISATSTPSANLLPASFVTDPGATEFVITGLTPEIRYRVILRSWEGEYNFSSMTPPVAFTLPESVPVVTDTVEAPTPVTPVVKLPIPLVPDEPLSAPPPIKTDVSSSLIAAPPVKAPDVPLQPSVRVLRDGIDISRTNRGELEVLWKNCVERGTTVTRYELAAGRAPGAGDILDWGRVTTGSEASRAQMLVPASDGETFFVSVRAMTSSGTPTAAYSSGPVLFDLSRPALRLLLTPTEPTSSSTAEFVFAADQPACRYRTLLDNWGWNDHGFLTRATYQGLAPGAHHLTVVATDPAGNESEPVRFIWQID